MKLSSFKNSGIAKKIKFVNGEMQVEESSTLNGEIVFYDLDIDRLKLINSEVMNKIDVETSPNEEVMFKLIPYLTDITVDIEFSEFLDIVENPSKQFTYVVNAIVDTITNVVNLAEQVIEIEEKSKMLTEKFNIEPVETKEEKLDRLYEELAKPISKERRKEIIAEITRLNES